MAGALTGTNRHPPQTSIAKRIQILMPIMDTPIQTPSSQSGFVIKYNKHCMSILLTRVKTDLTSVCWCGRLFYRCLHGVCSERWSARGRRL